MTSAMPAVRPTVPHFSSGPCAKRPNWSLSVLTDAPLGRLAQGPDEKCGTVGRTAGIALVMVYPSR